MASSSNCRRSSPLERAGSWPDRFALVETIGVSQARHNSLATLFFKMDAVTDAAQAIRQHGNQRLMLEVMALRLADKTV